MKPRFLSKKEREELKAQKNQPGSSNSAQTFQNKGFSQHTQKSAPSVHFRGPQIETKIQQKMQQQNKIRISQYTAPLQKQEIDNQQRQRSRDNKYKQLIKDEPHLIKYMKDQRLGLIKAQQSKRNSISYRNQLKFDWDKTDDTSQGFVPLIAQQHTYLTKKDQLEQQEEGLATKDFSKMTQRDWRIFRQDHQIYIRGGNAPNPFRQWKQLQTLDPSIVNNLLNLKFQKPRPVQMQAIPIGMENKDLMAIAPTGQGKTLAYLLPIIQFVQPLQKLSMNNFDKGPYALILVPTRQLAQQIQSQFMRIAKGLSITSFVAVGGRQFDLQAIELSKGCQLLIGTPGRVKQFIQKHQLSLEGLSWCVIDEADKMVSQNLSEDLQFILDHAGEESLFNGRKVIHMFSATMVPQVQKLGRSYLSASYTYITIGEPGGGKKEIQQHVQLINEASKPDRLTKILKNLTGPIIVFVNTRQLCDKVAKIIQKRQQKRVEVYHGGKSQEQREKVIKDLRSNKIQVLVATDIAGRGLDVKGINAVISYDAPKNISEFVHRSGRTGRAGMKGKAFTLLTPQDEAIFYDLRVFLQRNGFKVPQNLRDNVASQVRPGSIAKTARNKNIVYTN